MSLSDLLKASGRYSYLHWFLLLAYTIVIFSINIGSDGIYSAQEGRAAIVARNMIQSGDIFHVVIKGEPETEKPIMCYWFYAIAGKIFGVNEFSVRLPSILSVILCVMMAAWLGNRIYGRVTGLLSGYMLTTMIGFVNLGRIARIDIVLCAFFTAAMIFLYTGYFEKRKANWHLYIFYILLAFAVLVKGPVAVVMAALTILALLIKDRNFKAIWELKPVSGLIIGLLIDAPWYVYESVRTNGSFAFDFFWNQNIDRFLGINTEYSGGVRKTFFYYFPKLFAGALPWSLLVPFCLLAFRKKLNKLRLETYFLVFWVMAVFVFFSLSAIKRGDYILPLYPALAILIARYAALVDEIKPVLSGKWKIVWFALLGLVALSFVLLETGAVNYFGQLCIQGRIPHIKDRDGMGIVQTADLLKQNLALLMISVTVFFWMLYLIGRKLGQGRVLPAFASLMTILIIWFSIFYIWIDPATNIYKTTKYFCQQSQKHLPPDAVVAYAGSWYDEAVFFVNRDYERCKMNAIYDAETRKFKFKFIICPPGRLKELPEDIKAKMKKLEETISGHQYSLALYQVPTP
jgi:hypothetical protein